MKVLLLAPIPNHKASGGIGIWTGRMMECFPTTRWDIHVVSENHIGNRETYGDKAKRNLFDEIRRCNRIWKELSIALKDPDVKIVQSCIPAAFLSMLRETICAVLAKCSGKKYVVHFHCTVPDFANGIKERVLLRVLSKLTDSFIVLNSKSKEFVEAITEKEAHIIPNFISEREIGTKIVVSNTLKRIIYTGGITKDKGCLELFEVAKLFPSITFDLFGEYDQEMKNNADKSLNVVLHGVIEHRRIAQELQQSDVFIQLSHSEGFSISLLEAMTYGLPIIATDVGANKDMIGSNGGFIVPVNNVEKVAVEIEKMMDKDTRSKQSDSNYKRAIESYTQSAVIPMYLRVYDSLMNLEG